MIPPSSYISVLIISSGTDYSSILPNSFGFKSTISKRFVPDGKIDTLAD